MRRTGTVYTADEIKQLHLKGAVYIRMSTELQVESPENQERQIRAYATKYDIEIVKVYADLGVSGMTAEKREQFQALFDDVEQGRNEYNIVLYLDESRWGRFVDSRDADFYRMQLERKNVVCQSCDQPLTLASNIADRIITLLRDESASDYSRQLSQKVFIGQCNLIMKGYAKSLLDSTPKDQLIKKSVKKRVSPAALEKCVRLEEENITLCKDIGYLKETYGADIVNLTMVQAYLKRLLGNEKVASYLQKYHQVIHDKFAEIVQLDFLKLKNGD